MHYKKRFILSFITNFIKASIGATTSFLIARNLGPDETGRLFFLLFSFASFKGIFDLGTSSAFFTFLSKENQSVSFINIFFVWIFIQFITVLGFVAFIFPERFINIIWVNEDRNLILMAFVASFMLNNAWTITSQMGEAVRKTFQVQLIALFFTMLHIFIVIILIYIDKLGLQLILLSISFEWLIASILAYRLYTPDKTNRNQSLRSIIQMYQKFSLPLIPFLLLGVVYDFADKWMLQHWSGSTEQAYFGLAMRVSSIALLATNSLVKVFWKESALLAKEGKYNELFSIYKKSSSFLLAVSIFFVAAVHPFTEELIIYTLGHSYLGGFESMAVLLFYPIHQTLGQLIGTLMYATEQTIAYSTISSIFMLVSIFSTCILLAPETFFIPGLHLGSLGLSIKVVILNILSVNVLNFYMCKFFKWPFIFKYQVIPLMLIPLFYLLKNSTSIFSNNFMIQIIIYILFISFSIGFIAIIYRNRIISYYNEL